MTLAEIFEFKNRLNKEKEFFGYGTAIVNYMDVFKNTGIYKSDIKGKVFLTQQEIKNYEVKRPERGYHEMGSLWVFFGIIIGSFFITSNIK